MSDEVVSVSANSGRVGDGVRALPEKGEILTMGSYRSSRKEKKPIQWIVLEACDDRALLLSRFGIVDLSYHNRFAAVAWAECYMREWLNCEFLRKTFSADEQSLIAETEIFNIGENPTRDMIFQLGADEAEKYFRNNRERQTAPPHTP
ncbi:MAG: hypothetical protein IJ523_04975 [Succinivibrionaceae bacterium]|nr:hypothetical protein [Succinivibrionaceae bacterium]